MARHTEAETPFVPGTDEIAFLDSRRESTPLSHETLREKVSTLASEARRKAGEAGVRAHVDGTALRILYMRHADVVLGYPSFRALVLDVWADGEDDAWDRLRIARYYTEDQSRTAPTKLVLGVRVMEALGLSEMTTLLDAKKPHLLPLAPGGAETVTFDRASVAQLRQVLRVVKAPKAASEDELATLGRTRENIQALVEEDETFLALAPKAYVTDGDVAVAVRSKGRQGWRLAARFYEALAKRR